MMIWLGALLILLLWSGIIGFGLGFSFKEMSPFYDKSDYDNYVSQSITEDDDGMFWGSLFQQT